LEFPIIQELDISFPGLL